MLNKVDEKDPTVKALRAAEQRLNEVVAALPSKAKQLLGRDDTAIHGDSEILIFRTRSGCVACQCAE